MLHGINYTFLEKYVLLPPQIKAQEKIRALWMFMFSKQGWQKLKKSIEEKVNEKQNKKILNHALKLFYRINVIPAVLSSTIHLQRSH